MQDKAMQCKAMQFGATPLFYAAQAGLQEVVELLIAHNADPNIDSHVTARPLRLASEWGNAEFCQALLDDGADPTFKEGGRLAKTMAGNDETAAVIRAGEVKWKEKKQAQAA